MSEIYKLTPFRYRLRNEFPGRAGKLMRLANDRRVVRFSAAWLDSELADLKTYVAALRKDGIGVPEYDIVRAPRWDRPAEQGTYIVTESVFGERLDEIAPPGELDWQLPLPRQFYRQLYAALDQFVSALLNHYAGLLLHGGLVFKAMDESQFLYGTTRADRTPRVYFVDLDPTYRPLLPSQQRGPDINEAKTDFEKPVNIFFEMRIRHPRAPLPQSREVARRYFSLCFTQFQNFYSRSTPWWAKAPNFEAYQDMKERLLGM